MRTKQIIGLIVLHLYLVIRLGVTSPPWSREAAGMKRLEEPTTLRPGLTRPSSRVDERLPPEGGSRSRTTS